MRSFILFFLFTLLVPISSFSQSDNPAEWTILVFLNADNNLHDAGLDDINEMEKVGSTDKVNIIVQFDGKNHGDTKRYFIKKDDSSQVTSILLEDMGEVDMGSSENFKDFVLWGIEKYPAKHYFPIIWNHGSGWLQSMYQDNLLMGISYDDDSYNHMTTPQMGTALREISKKLGRKIDIYGSDACLMGMMEVAYEVKDYVDYIIGSEETEPFDGWPYDGFLSKLIANPFLSARDLSKVVVEEYGKSYNGGSQGTQGDTSLSAINSGELSSLGEEISIFAEKLKDLLPQKRKEIEGALVATRPFSIVANRDIFDFILKSSSLFEEESGIYASYYRIAWLLDYVVVANYAAQDLSGAFGLAIWLPQWKTTYENNREAYSELKFAQDTGWLDMLAEFHKPIP